MTDTTNAIAAIRREWGKRLLILGHHYQRSSVLQHADETGDSLELSRKAANRPEAERIVFCGVHFMAESADVLSAAGQTVYMPEMSAGCPMADMATAQDMQAAREILERQGGDWLPVVYVNSSAAIKACCGAWGGSTCTSSNARDVFKWVFDQGKRVFFLPDEHLGVNTAHDLGVTDEAVAVYDPRHDDGGLTTEQFASCRVIAWKGFCIVHQAFTVPQIEKIRAELPSARIIVHPEAPKEIVRLCDAHGSTAQIIKYVEAAQEGDTIVVGTEINLIQRLAEAHAARGVTVKALAPSVCANMSKTNERNLHDLLVEWRSDCVVSVPPEIAAEARHSLSTMLAL